MSKTPVYKAIQIDQKPIDERSGHTKPWMVTAHTPDGLIPYVIKLYNDSEVDNFHRITKEVIGNVLAQEFDLKVPQLALIKTPEFLTANLPTEIQDQWEYADHRLKFATLH